MIKPLIFMNIRRTKQISRAHRHDPGALGVEPAGLTPADQMRVTAYLKWLGALSDAQRDISRMAI
jgi:hypothetical protein